MKGRRLTPQQKKRYAYLKDHYNRGGESLPAWRRGKPIKKRKVIHAYRRKLNVQLKKVTGEEDPELTARRRYINPRQMKVEDWGVIGLEDFIKSRRARNQIRRRR